MAKTQLNVKVEQQLQNDFRRACSFDTDDEGYPRRLSEVLEELLGDYVVQVFQRKDVEKEIQRLKKREK